MNIILILLIMIVTPYSVFAAELVTGEREGKIKLHGQEFVPATFVVRSIKKDDGSIYKIEMIHDDRLYDFKQLTFDNDEIRFVLDTGQEYNCILFRDEKLKQEIKECKDKNGYCGECMHMAEDETQKLIIINIKPLQLEPEPPAEENAEAEDESRGSLENGNSL
jgi:hypothetical protein